MCNGLEIIVKAYCASEYALAEIRCHMTTNKVQEQRRAESMAKKLSSMIESKGIEIVTYSAEPNLTIHNGQQLLQRGDPYFSLSGSGGIFFRPYGSDNPEDIYEPDRQEIRLLAGRFSDSPFPILDKEVRDAINSITPSRK